MSAETEHPVFSEKQFMDLVKEAAVLVNERADADPEECQRGEHFGIPTEALMKLCVSMLSITVAQNGRNPGVPYPSEIAALMMKVFTLGVVFARKDLANDQN